MGITIFLYISFIVFKWAVWHHKKQPLRVGLLAKELQKRVLNFDRQLPSGFHYPFIPLKSSIRERPNPPVKGLIKRLCVYQKISKEMGEAVNRLVYFACFLRAIRNSDRLCEGSTGPS